MKRTKLLSKPILCELKESIPLHNCNCKCCSIEITSSHYIYIFYVDSASTSMMLCFREGSLFELARGLYIATRGKSLLKIAYVIFVILKSHDFFSVIFRDFSDF